MTPREFFLLADEYSEVRKEERLLVGLLAASSYNAAGATKGDREPWQPGDFFPDLKPERTSAEVLWEFDRAFSALKDKGGVLAS